MNSPYVTDNEFFKLTDFSTLAGSEHIIYHSLYKTHSVDTYPSIAFIFFRYYVLCDGIKM